MRAFAVKILIFVLLMVLAQVLQPYGQNQMTISYCSITIDWVNLIWEGQGDDQYEEFRFRAGALSFSPFTSTVSPDELSSGFTNTVNTRDGAERAPQHDYSYYFAQPRNLLSITSTFFEPIYIYAYAYAKTSGETLSDEITVSSYKVDLEDFCKQAVRQGNSIYRQEDVLYTDIPEEPESFYFHFRLIVELQKANI